MKTFKNSLSTSLVHLFLAFSVIAAAMPLSGCRGTCSVITRLETKPQWVCPGTDFSPAVHFRIENFDEKGNHSDDGTCVWKLWDSTKAKPNQPGSVSLTKKVGPLSHPAKGIRETPHGGVQVVAGSIAKRYRFSLSASNTECKTKGSKYLRDHQAEIEKRYGIDLDDNETMMAHTSVELISVPAPQRLCTPYAIDAQAGFTWVKDEVRGGRGIIIAGLSNPNSFPLEIQHILPPPAGTVYRTVGPGDRTDVFNGRTPNGRWAIKTLHKADHDNFLRDNQLKYTGKPSICVEIELQCQ